MPWSLLMFGVVVVVVVTAVAVTVAVARLVCAAAVVAGIAVRAVHMAERVDVAGDAVAIVVYDVADGAARVLWCGW